MKKRSLQLPSAFKAALPILLLSNTVLAADADRFLEETIVTAQKREQTLKDVPSSVSALSEDYLTKTGTRNFSEIGKIASGIEIGGESDGFGRSVRIRGVGTNKYVRAISPSVGIFLDDIPLVDPGVAFTNLADVERIEVLKGPQSTLFGKGVSSGAISIVTKMPNTEQHEAYVEANFSDLGVQDYRLGGNLALGKNLALRGGFYFGERDGDIENKINGKDGVAAENSGGRLRLLWQPSTELDVMLGYEKHNLESRGTNSVILEYGDIPEMFAAANPDVALIQGDNFNRVTQDSSYSVRETDTEISSLHVNWTISPTLSLASVTAYQDFSQGMPASELRDDNSSDLAINPFVISPFNTQMDLDSFSQELRLNLDFDSLVSTVGVFYSDSSGDTISPIAQTVAAIPTGADPLLLRVALLSSLTTDTEEWAIFTHNTFSFTDRWDVIVGLRYNEVERSDTSGTMLGAGKYAELQSPLIPVVSNWDAPKQTSDWKVFTGALKFTYDFNDEMTLYFGYDRGFKPGGHDSASHDITDPTGNSYTLNPAFSEEIGNNYEAGLKGVFLNRSLSWNGSVFYQVYDDYQVNVPDPITTFRTTNAAEVVVQGVEMDLQWLMGENLTIDGNLSYVDSRYDSYKGAGCVTPQYVVEACTLDDNGNMTQDLSDEQLNLVSPWTGNLNATWNDQFSNGLNWYVRGEVAFRDERTTGADLDPATRVPSYTLFNASMGLNAENGKWSTILWAKNLTDKDYYLSIEDNIDGISRNGFRGIIGEERTVGVTLKYQM